MSLVEDNIDILELHTQCITLLHCVTQCWFYTLVWFYTSVLIGRIETNIYEDVCGLRNVQGSRPTWSVDILHPCRCRYFGNVLNLSWGWYKLSYYRSSTWRLMGTSRRGGRRNMWWRCDPLSFYLSASCWCYFNRSDNVTSKKWNGGVGGPRPFGNSSVLARECFPKYYNRCWLKGRRNSGQFNEGC